MTNADDPIDGIAPFLRDKTVEELVQRVIKRREAWLRGEVRCYTMEEAQQMAFQWTAKDNPNS